MISEELKDFGGFNGEIVGGIEMERWRERDSEKESAGGRGIHT